MRGTKFFGIGAAFVTCVLALLLIGEAGFVSIAQAKGKPTKPGKTVYIGYAELADVDPPYMIQSDGQWVNEGEDIQYSDKRLTGPNMAGEDEVEITIDENGDLAKIWTGLGSIQYASPRRVHFDLGIARDRVCENPKAVYDILVDRGTLDSTVHFGVGYWASTSVADYAVFIIDPGWDDTDPAAITQEAVNTFDPDDENENYRTTDHGHVSYYLGYPGYPQPPCIAPVPVPGDSNKWTITCSGPVTLYVMRTVGKGKSKGGAYERVELATYDPLPFNLTVTKVEKLAEPQNAPPRVRKALSVLWGEIKAQ